MSANLDEHLKLGMDTLFDGLKAILGTLPADAQATKDHYAGLLEGLAADVASGALTLAEAQYEARQLENGLIQSLGTIALDAQGKVDGAVGVALQIILRMALGALA